MKEIAGRGAVVTGAAGGIGLGISRALAKAGMRVVMADFDEAKLRPAAADIAASGATVVAAPVDVSDPQSVRDLAAFAADRLGALHVLCNNAGVGYEGVPLDDMPDADWDWVLGVNLHGVVNCLQAFLPLLKAHGEEAHIVNTASIGGLQVRPGFHRGAYCTTKYALVGLSEALRNDLAAKKIGVSVLCPAAVDTEIYRPNRNRPARFGPPYTGQESEKLRRLLKQGKHPDEIGRWVERAIRDNVLFILPHGETREWLEKRHKSLMAAYDWAAEVETDVVG